MRCAAQWLQPASASSSSAAACSDLTVRAAWGCCGFFFCSFCSGVVAASRFMRRCCWRGVPRNTDVGATVGGGGGRARTMGGGACTASSCPLAPT